MTRRHLSIATRLRVLAPILGLLILGPTLDSIAPNSVHAGALATTHSLPSKAVVGVQQLCGPTVSYPGCTNAGYNGTQGQFNVIGWTSGQYWFYGSGGALVKHNCTTYVAYRLEQNGYAFPGWTGNARDWATKAALAGTLVNQIPAVGSVAQWNANHVAYVESIDATGIVVTADNYFVKAGNPYNGGYTDSWHINFTSNAMPDNFIHFKDVVVGPPPFNPAPYVGHLVQWKGDTKAQKTSWLVGIDGKRRWIPDAATYNCLASFGAPHAAADILSSTILDQLTDLTGVRATCDALLPNWSMVQGQTLASLSKEYWLTFQTDGNLVLYRTCAAPNAPVALWASFAGTAKKFVMQSDGNFVGYNTLTPTSTNNAVWSTKTANGALSQLLMQSDGNLVVYTASSATWSTGTNGGVSRLTPPQTCPAPPPPPTCPAGQIGTPPNCTTPPPPPPPTCPAGQIGTPPNCTTPPPPPPPTCPAGQIGTPPNCTTPPPPTCPAGQIGTPPNCTTPPPPPPTTWVEKVWWTSAGAFSAGPGAGIVSTIQPTGTLVTVDCRAYNLAVATSNTGGWWYHLVSPFAGQWTPASLYWNDPTGTALWDPAVRVC